ncbi:MAG: hypothetical protein PVH88_16990 [Ignavibacteria bacterium]|jgi:hypothetical protein
MSQYEFLTLLISILAILLSVYALIQNHRIARKQYELDLKQSKLAEKQLQLIEEDEIKKEKADIKLNVMHNFKNDKLNVQNVGLSTAYDVSLEIIPAKGKGSPLVDYKSKFPLEKLDPGDSVELLWAVDTTTGNVFNSICKWKNKNGKEEIKETQL